MVEVKVSVPYHRIVPDKPISGDFCVEITIEPEHASALAAAILARHLQFPNHRRLSLVFLQLPLLSILECNPPTYPPTTPSNLDYGFSCLQIHTLNHPAGLETRHDMGQQEREAA